MGIAIVTSTVSVKEVINIPAGPAWEILSSFKGIEEFSSIVKSCVKGKGLGAERTCVMSDGIVIKELLIELNHNLMKMAYEIMDTPLPIENYIAFICVIPKGPDSCEIHYRSSYKVNKEDEGEIMKTLQKMYVEIIHGLERYIKVA